MKLKEYNTPPPRKNIIDIPIIRFSDKGIISINSVAAEALNLESGVKISFAQDTERPKDWFLRTNVHTGVSVRTTHQNRKSLVCSYREVSCEVLKSTGADKYVRFKLCTEMHDGMYAIITANKL